MGQPGFSRFFARACAILLAAFVASAPAQNVNDGYVPQVNGAVNAIVVQPDGKALIAGDFTLVNSQTCARLCRLRVDGSVDPAFVNPNANAAVNAIAVRADGRILVGGSFTQIGGLTRKSVAMLGVDGSVTSFADPAQHAPLGYAVNAIAVRANGEVLVGGCAMKTQCHIQRLDAKGGVDASFVDLQPSGAVNELVLQPDGKMLVGGAFTTIGGQTHNRVARLNADGGVDASFLDTGANDTVYALAPLADGTMLVAGAFTGISGRAASRIACLDAIGRRMPTATFVDSNVNAVIVALAMQPDGKVLIGGDFTSVGGQTRVRLARLNAGGTLDAGFADTGANARVNALAVQPDGNVLIGGAFSSLNGQPQNYLARANVDGSLDADLADPAVTGEIYALATQPDGKVLVGGNFASINGAARGKIARLNANGSIDPGFVDAGFDGNVDLLVVQGDGKVLVGGRFITIGGLARNRIARLNADGTLDTGFVDPNPDDAVAALAVQSDGKVLVAGDFTRIGGQPHAYIARLNANGTPDPGFIDPGVNGIIEALALQADGKVLIAGRFRSVGTRTTCGYTVRLNADGSFNACLGSSSTQPTNFNDKPVAMVIPQATGKMLLNVPGYANGQQTNLIRRIQDYGSVDLGFAGTVANGTIFSLLSQVDGTLLAGGSFQVVGVDLRKYLARVKPAGGVDASFADFAATGSAIYALAMQTDGSLLIGGYFTQIQGRASKGFARLSAADAALKSLDVEGSTVTWHRSGAGPELALPPILYASANCTDYTAIGSMSRVADGWQLGGVALPVGWFCLRAQGRVGSGQNNGSQGLIESVRRVWRDDRIFRNGFE